MFFFAEWSWIQIPFHSLIESLGTFAALSLAVFILLLRKFEQDSTIRVWISCALIAMGILDGFHAAVSPSTVFVWLHSIATLTGGFFFLWVFLPERTPKGNWANLFTGGITIAVIFIGAFSIAYAPALPEMTNQEDFTLIAKAINIIGGLFFLSATLRLMYRYWVNTNAEDFLFANLALLFCVSNLLFQFSHPWKIEWWFWHLLRVIAYLIALSYIFITFRKAQTFKVSNELLEQHNEVLRRLMRETQEAVNVLTSSTAEIMTAATQVATGAVETATAVNETTSTVEEVKQTAQVTTQKAKYVSDSAQKNVLASQAGRKAVDESIDGMNRIREQMESIADNILHLSEQSQTIGEIIAVVNDLSDQSNLLAVNAAIEAAKAGEQGKGFSVVAQEVRRLAEQSKQATAQVRTILNNIVKSVNQVAMATEQGSKAVESGAKYAKESGEVIKLLAESVTEAFQAATQISASIQQQLVGVDQVAQAMENINQVSVMNVTSTKQVETAAQNLNELGQKLKEMAAQYTV